MSTICANTAWKATSRSRTTARTFVEHGPQTLIDALHTRDSCLQAPIAKEFAGLLVADAKAGAGSEHACSDVHGEEFLEEQFGGVRDMNLGDASLVVAGAAFVFALLELTVYMLVI